MRISLFATIAVVILAGACRGNSTGITDCCYLAGRVEVTAEGGIAAQSIVDRVDHPGYTFMHVRRGVCASGCPASQDSASGVLPPASVDSLFALIAADTVGLKDDYGSTLSAADMMSYTVRITRLSGTKIIRADDGTMPPPLRRIVEAVRATIASATR